MSAVASKTLIPTGTWVVDPAHTTIAFQVTDTTDLFSTIVGRFSELEGRIEGGDEPSFAGAVRVASLSTDNEQRDAHLLSPDFLEAEKHPEIRFQSTSIEPAGEDRVPRPRRADRQGDALRDRARDARSRSRPRQARRRAHRARRARRLRVGHDHRRAHGRRLGGQGGVTRVKVLGIAGSLRSGSHNRALIRAARELARRGGGDRRVRSPRAAVLRRRRRGSRRSRGRHGLQGRDPVCGRAPDRDARVQPRNPGRAQERDRLGLPPGARVAARRQARGDPGRLHRPRRNPAGAAAAPRGARVPARSRPRRARGPRPRGVHALRRGRRGSWTRRRARRSRSSWILSRASRAVLRSRREHRRAS